MKHPKLSPSTVLHVCIVFIAFALHVTVMESIVHQPLKTHADRSVSPEERPLIWNLHTDTLHRLGPGADFFALYHAGVVVRQNKGMLHDPRRLANATRKPPRRHARRLNRPLSIYKSPERIRKTPYFYSYRYLPALAKLLGHPITILSPQHAYTTWIFILEAALFLLLITLWLQPAPRWVRTALTTSLLLSSPFFLEAHMGQFTFLTVSLLLTAILIDRRIHHPPKPNTASKPITALRLIASTLFSALAFTSAVLIKIFPLVTAPALLKLKRHWPTVLLAIIALLALNVPDFQEYPELWSTFRKANFTTDPQAHTGNFSLYSAIWTTLDAYKIPTPDILHTLLQWIPITLAALLVFFSKIRDLRILAPTLLLAHFVGYMHVWEHHFSAVLPLGTLLALHLTDPQHTPPNRSKIPLTLVLLSLVAIALPTHFALLDTYRDPLVANPGLGWSLTARLSLIATKSLPLLTLFGVALYTIARNGFSILPFDLKKPQSADAKHSADAP